MNIANERIKLGCVAGRHEIPGVEKVYIPQEVL